MKNTRVRQTAAKRTAPATSHGRAVEGAIREHDANQAVRAGRVAAPNGPGIGPAKTTSLK